MPRTLLREVAGDVAASHTVALDPATEQWTPLGTGVDRTVDAVAERRRHWPDEVARAAGDSSERLWLDAVAEREAARGAGVDHEHLHVEHRRHGRRHLQLQVGAAVLV